MGWRARLAVVAWRCRPTTTGASLAAPLPGACLSSPPGLPSPPATCRGGYEERRGNGGYEERGRRDNFPPRDRDANGDKPRW